ncbi:hypothetical protein SAMN05421821_103154 [Mucilaginibacter lappiensis]|uniref:Uncharacterized protein n=1 Tax=Mucilaginibacter lappiensis TaxID=354630 RepID=A0ABR6PGN2_9SPHI|nr:hypothetical protein [Mucilaginibacter lappiensis]MBB6108920.1 hypothetical protein [Mucilaginibacter lappiensis]SIQ67890.1 hypothetical protein SAMN05421821_103154 [Mucilaginibacter lappiensis]
MAILTIQIPDSEVATLSSIVTQVAGSVIKVNADEDVHTNECLQKEDFFIENKLARSGHKSYLWND